MTTIESYNKPLKRESLTRWRGRPLILELGPFSLTVREKGRRAGYEVDYQAIFSLGAKKKAQEVRAERASKKKVSK